ncbi:MAG: preprotein translocase subunit SecA [Pirellulaceae bacterium]
MPIHSSQSDHSLIRKIRRQQAKFAQLDDAGLRDESLRLKYEVLRNRPLPGLMAPAFGLVIEASRRTTGLVPFDVQIQGAIDMARLKIAEMKTGEGKTLAATMPAFLYALAGRGTHIVTVNDYLAARDAREMGPIFRLLGLSVGVVQTGDDPALRREAWQRDITYATSRELGFDFLRDRITTHAAGPEAASQFCRHRPFHFAIIDEADSILIDEARTPLVIAMVNPDDRKQQSDCLRWAAEFAPEFLEEEDYQYERDSRRISLLAHGMVKLKNLPQNEGTRDISVHELRRYMENAIKVHRDFHREKTYTVRDDEVVIIDEFTGRIAEGRQWQDGLHQAVEARESLEISTENRQTASITIQTLFRLYPHLAGMTGTAWTSRREFRQVFARQVTRVPTNRPLHRTTLPVRVFADESAKYQAVVDEAQQMVAAGRAVLIGTRTVEHSECLSEQLQQAGIEHQVLNANQNQREAEIVAAAGQAGRVTVATNMAGRGTDIKLAGEVRDAGGLHVILTEIHEAARVDWQLIGRGCRQGDPGSCRIFVSLDDEILTLGFGNAGHERIVSRYSGKGGELSSRLFRLFLAAQRRLESRYLTDRMILRRQDKDRRQQFYELGLDPYLFATTSSR